MSPVGDEQVRLFKLAFVVLVAYSIIVIGISYREDIRQVISPYHGPKLPYLPYPEVDESTGMDIVVHRLSETPQTYVEIEDDTFIADAISHIGNSSHRTCLPDFVRLEDGNWADNLHVCQTTDGEWWAWRPGINPSEWETKGHPDYVLWIPGGNYYFVDKGFYDGVPHFTSRLQSPAKTTTIAALVVTPWIGLAIATIYYKSKTHSAKP